MCDNYVNVCIHDFDDVKKKNQTRLILLQD